MTLVPSSIATVFSGVTSRGGEAVVKLGDAKDVELFEKMHVVGLTP